MVRIKTQSPRKKPEKSKKKNATDFQEWIKSFSLTIAIWLLVGVNLIFVVSMFFQVLKAGNGESIDKPQRVVTDTKAMQDIITVEVLNGCGEAGVAGKLRSYLVDRKFDVVDFKNYDRWDIPETLVIDRKYMDKKNAKTVADAIGVKKDKIFPQISPQRKLDVSVIIGKDFKELKAFK
jgi:hypothetical protein